MRVPGRFINYRFVNFLILVILSTLKLTKRPNLNKELGNI